MKSKPKFKAQACTNFHNAVAAQIPVPLAVFDLLSNDKNQLTKADRDKIKKVAVSLLAKLESRKQEMANLRDRASAQANLKASIIDEMLNGMPDKFSSEDINVRAEILFRHVGGKSILHG